MQLSAWAIFCKCSDDQSRFLAVYPQILAELDPLDIRLM
jgi:hypothetical protein